MSALLLATTVGASAQDLDGDGYTVAAGDCDDADPTVAPGFVELAGDNVDQDCSGTELCYRDDDDDGARTTSTVVSADADCLDPFEGLAVDPIDCDDTNPLVSPTVVGDLCGMGDTDCDGRVASVGDLLGPAVPTAGALNSWDVVGGPPTTGVVVVASTTRGAVTPPACPAMSLGLSAPSLVGFGPTDPLGDATVSRSVPAGMAGATVFAQGFFPATCEATCIEITTF